MILNNALRTIVNAERRGKATVELQPISTVMSSFLKIMKNRGKSILLIRWILFINNKSAFFYALLFILRIWVALKFISVGGF